MGCMMGSRTKKLIFTALFAILFFALAACTRSPSEPDSGASMDEEAAVTIWAWDEGFNIAAAKTA